ncbi:hypothetical protein DRJ22_00980 [Candidatus Woesearchaeota archaeon]|nr:MAG: hypothetical protein B6U93_01525 [Candidatus Woesearchaeota archaeon ex4484_78]RLE46823.1 MAG: hypothetical protein DRJ22_00980 [Candidatus Woesearchaeota archaeon]
MENKNIIALVFIVFAFTAIFGLILSFSSYNKAAGMGYLWYGSSQPKVYGGAIKKYLRHQRYILEGSSFNPYAQKKSAAQDIVSKKTNNLAGPISEFDAMQKIKAGYKVVYIREKGGYFYNPIK